MYVFYSKKNELINNKIKQLTKKGNLLFGYEINEFFELEDIYNYIVQEKIFVEKECLLLKTNKEDFIIKNRSLLLRIKDIISNKEHFKICFLLESNTIELKNDVESIFEKIVRVNEFTQKQKEILVESLINQKSITYKKEHLLELIDKLPNDENIIRNEISKLNSLDKNSLDLINDYTEYNLFKIFEYWLNKDYKNMILLMNQYFSNDDQITFFMNYFIKKISEFYLIKILVKQGKTLQEISAELKYNFFTLKNDWNKISLLSLQEIEKILYNLYNLEKKSRLYQLSLKNLLKEFFLLKEINGNK